MKILLVVRWPVGGIRTYLRYIYSQSIYCDYSITILAPDLEFSAFIGEYLPRDTVRYLAAPNSDRGLMKAVRELLKIEDFDLVHSHGYSAGVLTVLANPFNKPVHIMTAHDVYRPDQFRGIAGKAKLVLINLLFSRLSGVLTVGDDCLGNFSQYIPLVKKSRLKNIDHGVDVYRFSNAQARDFRKELDISKDRKIIGFFGRFMSQKGFIDLVRAIKILSDQFAEGSMPVVLTFGWGGYIREDFEIIDRLGLKEYFIQLPFTDDVPSAIKGVDMVAMPSRWEACGLLAMEVLAAGVPLIGTTCIGLRCVLEGTPALGVSPWNPQELARAIANQLTKDNSLFIEYQPIAVQRFNMERPANELHHYYQNLGVGRQECEGNMQQ